MLAGVHLGNAVVRRLRARGDVPSPAVLRHVYRTQFIHPASLNSFVRTTPSSKRGGNTVARTVSSRSASSSLKMGPCAAKSAVIASKFVSQKPASAGTRSFSGYIPP